MTGPLMNRRSMMGGAAAMTMGTLAAPSYAFDDACTVEQNFGIWAATFTRVQELDYGGVPVEVWSQRLRDTTSGLQINILQRSSEAPVGGMSIWASGIDEFEYIQSIKEEFTARAKQSESGNYEARVRVDLRGRNSDFLWTRYGSLEFNYTGYVSPSIDLGRDLNDIFALFDALERENAVDLNYYIEHDGAMVQIWHSDISVDDLLAASRASDQMGARLSQQSEGADCYQEEGCFLTTACCGHYGRPDNGLELSTLRRFRDGYLAASTEGAREIGEYYRLGPQICRAINADAAGGRVLRGIYWGTILPCVVLIRLGLNGLTHRLYRRMVRRLQLRYGIA
ncbi:CFI-box-CTERM domain-containing protein [Roseovarius sp. ZX-A-9]|uniref:CFI-box-CTERM domain-containing protein n=1 Tax=Roseovarius sp. ZX-A-9 TaxID=3014783 RepID=UPI00232E6D85|nr:CFI-box-CTERM domain-containing protein [Roseovarius sp. ZX-A-9]